MSIKTIREQYDEELVLFKKNVQLMAKDMFEGSNELAPFLFALIIKEDKLVVAVLGGLGMLFINDEGKVAAAKIMREFNKEMKPIATAFVCEGWAKIVSAEDAIPYVNADGDLVDPLRQKPSKAKDKKEVLMFMFETHDKESAVNYEIKRNPADPADVKLEKLMDTEWSDKKEGHVGGVMADLLEENYSEFAQTINRINSKENLN